LRTRLRAGQEQRARPAALVYALAMPRVRPHHVLLGFRLEDTDLVGPNEGGMPIHVDLVEELGSDAYVYGTVALEGNDERFVVRVDPRKAPQLGDIVQVKPRVGAHHAFHGINGERL
jgi:multiple sugar transport system ATP-binding protein